VALTTKEIEQLREYFNALQAARTDQESARDSALLLIIGGALTVSAAFVPSMMERLGALRAVPLLEWAWGLWIAALFLHLLGFTVSIQANRHMCRRLNARDLNLEDLKNFWNLVIDISNALVMVLAVAGFITFGIFTYRNLDQRVINGQSKEKSQKESNSILPEPSGQHSAGPGAGLPTPAATQKEESKVTPVQH
jgi:hypothetical protein